MGKYLLRNSTKYVSSIWQESKTSGGRNIPGVKRLCETRREWLPLARCKSRVVTKPF